MKNTLRESRCFIKLNPCQGVFHECWNPTDLFKVDLPPVLAEKQKQRAIRNAIKLLASQGIIVVTEPPSAA